MSLDLAAVPVSFLYSISNTRWRYGRNPELLNSYITENNHWFVERAFSALGGKRPHYGNTGGTTWGYVYDPASKEILKKAQEFMRDFCMKSDVEIENLLVSRSVVEATKYSIKTKGQRLEPDVEKAFLERCKGKKSRLSSLMNYCGHWGIMPENMTEITLVAGFEGGRRGEVGKGFIKKLTAEKKKCRDLIAQIMKLEGIGEDEPIKKIMESLK